MRGGGGVAPAAKLLFSPLCPLINMQMKDICKTPGCQITSNKNLADFSHEIRRSWAHELRSHISRMLIRNE